MKTLISALALASALTGLDARAAFGDLDPSYAGPAATGCNAIEPREDGGAYVDVISFNPATGGNSIGIERLDAHGFPISRFDGQAIAVFPVPSPSRVIQILRGKDGDVFAVDEAGIAHVDAGGRPDFEFGSLGRVTLPGTVLSAAVQGDGKIVALTVDQGRYAFIRLNAQGFFDTSFGRSGTPLFAGPAPIPFTVVYGWAVRSDGGVELGTYSDLSPDVQLKLTVLSATFHEVDAGSRIVPQGIATWIAPQAKVDPTGGLVLGRPGGLVTRFNADGTLDTSFGTAGTTIVLGITGQRIATLWREPDGKWTVIHSGVFNSGFIIYNDNYWRATRLTSAGQRDSSLAANHLGPDVAVAHASDGSILIGCAPRRLAGDAPRVEGKIVEYYHADLDHYFMTSSPNEIAGVDSNPLGWFRTGETFGDWTPANLPGAAHVCRFYGDPVIGPNSHFYTGEDFECQGLIALEAATPPGVPVWHLEAKPFDITIPSGGSCPANLQRVYRVFNGPASNGHGPNHRYTTDPKVYAAMQAKGWIPEGVHFCAPPRTN
ncbi:MAG: hypothetical protein ACXWGT_03265 [Usitatibacter sp.]